MARYEILKVDLAADGLEKQAGLLESVLTETKNRLSATAQSIGKVFSKVSENMEGPLNQILSVFKSLSDNKKVKSTVTTIKRAVAGFDELNRLNKKTVTTSKSGTDKTLDLEKTMRNAARLGEAVKDKVIDPLSQWASGKFPASLGIVSDAFGRLFGKTEEASASTDKYGSFWDKLNQKILVWMGLSEGSSAAASGYNTTLQGVAQNAQTAGTAMGNLGNQVSDTSGKWQGLKGASSGTWENIQSVWIHSGSWFGQNVTDSVGSKFSGLWSRMKQDAAESWGQTQSVFSNAGGFFEQVFSNAWKKVTGVFSDSGEVFVNLEDGVLTGFTDVVNELIDGINEVVSKPFQGLNGILGRLQNVQLGSLKPFSFLSWRAKVPQIPHLAQGAVLPANKPFLAMVGDQTHGTNVEAPLATIQEAVALVMEDFISSNMAGHEATVAVLREILEAVLGIQIGDDVIASAYDRYRTKMAVVKGG